MKTIIPFQDNSLLEINIPGSKSYANRYLIIAALNKSIVKINNPCDAQDVLDMINSLKKIGLDIHTSEAYYEIRNSFPECEQKAESPIEIHSGEGGTTNRFLLGLLSRGKNTYRLFPEGKILDRPFEDLAEAFEKLGVDFRQTEDFFEIKGNGNLPEKPIKVDCTKTTQGISALLLAGYNAIPENLFSSVKYFNLTRAAVKERESLEFFIPIDMSSAGYAFALGVLYRPVRIKNLKSLDINQADSVMAEIIKTAGASIEINSDGTLISPSKLTGFNFNCEDAIDLSPTLFLIASYASGPSYFKNTENLKFKESDRLEEMLTILRAFNINYTLDENTLTIQGNALKMNDRVNLSPAYDHRMVMVGALFQGINNGGDLANSKAVNKSFPSFFDLLF